MNKSIKALEFDIILNHLSENAVSETAKQKLLSLSPFLSLKEVTGKIQETTEARKIIDTMGTPPLPSMKEIQKLLDLAEKGAMLLPEQLTLAAQFITGCNRMKTYLKRAETLGSLIACYGNSIEDLKDLANEIQTCIRGNQVDDSASRELKNIRVKKEALRYEIKVKLDSMLRSKKEWFTDGFVSTRNGHLCLPVKKEYKHQVGGSTLDISATGSTYFILPSSVSKLESEISLLDIGEDNEVRKILYTLTALFHESGPYLRNNMEAIEILDIIFAKGKLSYDMKAVPPLMNADRKIKIVKGIHPLLKAKEGVPLNFYLGNDVKGIVITGPNTGGKTVALKTVGLFALMAQSGLHLPCKEAELCMNNTVLCDIGDGQSISENLSTFSAHITNIIDILNHSDKDSLILLDELGSGTDPAEGMGIAIAILHELKEKNCLFVATTHYPEVKDYADKTDGLVNARMVFDKETLKPLYRLEIGTAGESCALYIAKRLGLPGHMLQRAYKEAYQQDKNSIQREEADITEIDSLNLNSSVSLKASAPSLIPNLVIEKEKEHSVNPSHSARFSIGDSVLVYPQKKIGIVYQTANEKGEIGVQIQKQKQLINHKRLKLKASATELYPKDYDFSIIFDSVENRKARHKMDKGHQPGLEIIHRKEES